MTVTDSNGYKNFKKVGEKLRADVAEKEEVKIQPKEVNTPSLPQEYFSQNANIGLSSLTNEDVPLPGLTIIQSTSKIRDDEGRPYVPGQLYYKALKKATNVIDASILVITKRQMPSYLNREQLERTFVVLGCIEPGFMPFVLYAKGTSYFVIRKFIGEVKARKTPMYALKVQISTEKQQNDSGEWYLPVFNIVGMRTNPEEIIMLENLAKDYDMNQEGIRSEEENVPEQKQVTSYNAEEEKVNLNDIPF